MTRYSDALAFYKKRGMSIDALYEQEQEAKRNNDKEVLRAVRKAMGFSNVKRY